MREHEENDFHKVEWEEGDHVKLITLCYGNIGDYIIYCVRYNKSSEKYYCLMEQNLQYKLSRFGTVLQTNLFLYI